jgi:C4-dicarboxylate-specific signal transduction histidine kinase
MAGGIAHEINSPLGAIRLNAEMIISKNQKLPQPDSLIAKKAEAILNICMRIGKIISGLKSFSRDSNLTDAEEFSVQQLIDGTLDLCQEKLKSNGVDLTINTDNFSASVFGKSVEISQTLLNLINNAFDAITTKQNPWITIEAGIKDSFLELSVTDCGNGIPPQVVEQMFQPFFTTKGIGKGTGLGLSISRGLVQKHGGDLYYDSESPNTKFIIKLPLLQKKQGAA